MTLLSCTQISAEIEAGLLIQIRSCIPDTPRAIGAIMRRDWHPTELQKRFLTILRQVAEKQVSNRI